MATSLTQSIDNRGFPFEAIRPAASWVFSMSGATNYSAGPFLATTRVIRITTGLNDFVRVKLFGQTNPIIIGRGIPQDFVLQPGDTVVLQLDPLSASGNATVIELA